VAKALFFDTDILVLMAGANLIEDLVEALGAERAYRLAALDPMLQRALVGKGSLARQFSPGILQRAQAWAGDLTPIRDRPADDRLFESLLEVRDIDPGEALLFEAVAHLPAGVVATADKRACEVLATAESLSEVRDRLHGKILCLEVALEILLERVGYARLAERLSVLRECSGTLRLLLREGAATPQRDFLSGLESYKREIEGLAGPLLYRP
jgi:hypothetical protein